MIYNDYSDSFAGSIAGWNEGDITDCTNYGDIYSVGGKGAFTPFNHGTISGCVNYGRLRP